MRDFIKSSLRFSWAMSLFGVQQFENVIGDVTRQDSKTATAFDSITKATEEQLGSPVRSAFMTGDQLQSGMVDMMCGVFPISGGQPQSPQSANPGSTSPSSTGWPSKQPAEPATLSRLCQYQHKNLPGSFRAIEYILLHRSW